jgi:hypothetical protein
MILRGAEWFLTLGDRQDCEREISTGYEVPMPTVHSVHSLRVRMPPSPSGAAPADPPPR